MDTKERIYQFFVQKKRAEGLDYDTELLRSKHINSLFALEIVRFVEKEFSVKLPRKEISEANFRSINAIAALVERLQGK
ncbi:MAG: acyl carrier protein [Oscillospiraceae bacterium]|nr:acyl carrier protein [Oscillospiraceae bacterium]